MSIIGSNILAGASGGAGDTGYQIQRSLRFNASDSSHLSKTFSSAGNRKTWTWSAWVKRTKLATQEMIFQANNSGSLTSFYFNSADTALFLVGGGSIVFQTARKFRDPSSWMHLVLAVDTTQPTAFDRIKFYVNGVKLTSDQYSTSPAPSINTEYEFSNACAHYLSGTTYGHANSYMADVHFVDGQALAPTDFGEFDSDTGVWNPKEFTGNHNYAGSSGTINTLQFTGNGPHGPHAIRVDGTVLTGANYTNGTLGSWSSNATNPGGSFDGNTTGGNLAYSNNGQAITWTSNGGLSYNSKVEIYVGNITPFYVNINGGGASSALTINSWNTIAETGAGTNGFYLKFADNSSNAALGTDGSGNSNTWTVNNMVAASKNYASYVYAGGATYSATETGKAFYTGDGDDLFDGTTNNYVGGENVVGGTIYFRPETAITGVTSIDLYGAYNGETRVNGSVVTVSPSWSTSDQYVSVQNPPSTITEISVKGNTSLGAAARLKAIKVNGSMLVDSPAKDVDSLVDTPTNYGDDTGAGNEVRGNYCTINPLLKGTNTNLANGNLEINSISAGWNSCFGTFKIPTSGKWYWEVTAGGANTTMGLVNITSNHIGSINTYPSGSMDVYMWYGNGNKYTQGATAASYGSTFTAGAVIGTAFDADAGTLTFYLNGTSQGVAFTGLTDEYIPVFGTYDTGVQKMNFGQRSWAYAPPSGYKALCTQNLSEPTIADGSAYMDVVTYTGNASARIISGLGFSPDLAWFKDRSQGYHHGLFDTVRGANKLLASSQTAAEVSYTQSLTAFTSDGFSLGNNSDGNNTVNINNNGYVAWAWDAGANSSKTYAVTVVSDSGNKYRFDGHGTSAVTLELEEGSTYTFDQSDSSNAGHPLRFSTTSNGTHGGGSEYTTGVVTSGTPGSAGAYTKITIAASAPTLYYYCTQHSGMGGQINTNSTAGATVLSGSLNSSAYDQSQTWSNGFSGTNHGSSPIANAFDGNLSNIAYSLLNTTSTVTLPGGSITLDTTSSLRVYGLRYGGTNTFFVNGNNYTTQINNSVGWYTITGETQITSIAIGNYNSGNDYTGIYAIEVNGKILVDSNVTPPTVPSINSVVRANPAAGFSVVSYTGNNTNSTVAHGLNAAPGMVIVKNRDQSYNWSVYHDSLAATQCLLLNSNGATISSSPQFNNSKTTSTTFPIGAGGNTNYPSGSDLIAYCFAPVEGYSAMGSYTGNGSDDGPFVFTGMRPKWVLIKASSSTSYGNWIIHDSERSTVNVSNKNLYANLTNAEDTTYAIDFLANGFKIRSSSYDAHNGSGKTYIYAAFAENPFRTARAR